MTALESREPGRKEGKILFCHNLPLSEKVTLSGPQCWSSSLALGL